MLNPRGVLAVAVVLAGCGAKTSSSLELEMTGRIGTWTINEKGPWTGCPKEGCRPFIWVSYGAWIAPGFSPTSLPKEPSIGIQTTLLDGRILMGAIEIDALFNRPDGAALVEVDMRGGSNVDRLYATGDPAEPWRADIVMDGTINRPEGPFTYKGKMSIFPLCGERREQVESPCGMALGDDAETAWFTKFNRVALPEGKEHNCPQEIAKLFYTPGVAWKGDPATRTIRSGSASPLQCVITPTRMVVCGATQDNVQAEGCTWKVDALMGPFFNVGAKASGCTRDLMYCNIF